MYFKTAAFSAGADRSGPADGAGKRGTPVPCVGTSIACPPFRHPAGFGTAESRPPCLDAGREQDRCGQRTLQIALAGDGLLRKPGQAMLVTTSGIGTLYLKTAAFSAGDWRLWSGATTEKAPCLNEETKALVLCGTTLIVTAAP